MCNYQASRQRSIARLGLGWRLVLAILALGFSFGSYAATDSYYPAVKVASPSVVNIFTTREVRREQTPYDHPILRYYFGNQGRKEEVRKATSLGSGVIIDRKGYILTNNHVIDGATVIDVALADGKQAQAKVIGRDAATDLAVLQVKLSGLQPIVEANSDDLQVGDVVLAIGNPYGLGQTVTQGIISALGRNALGINQLENFIQTDAAINPGNSGGALVDVSGHLVGVNSAIFSRSGGNHGIGFAIPVNLAQDIFTQLVKYGKINRGWLGVKVVTLNPQLQKQLATTKTSAGVVVVGVELGSPANRAGLMTGDIIIKASGKKVDDTAEFIRVVAKTKPKQVLRMTVIRHNKRKQLRVRVGERPKSLHPVSAKKNK